ENRFTSPRPTGQSRIAQMLSVSFRWEFPARIQMLEFIAPSFPAQDGTGLAAGGRQIWVRAVLRLARSDEPRPSWVLLRLPGCKANCFAQTVLLERSWLGREDSNLHNEIQNL